MYSPMCEGGSKQYHHVHNIVVCNFFSIFLFSVHQGKINAVEIISGMSFVMVLKYMLFVKSLYELNSMLCVI